MTKVKTKEFVATLREDGIIHVVVSNNTHITIDIQVEMVKAYWSLTTIKRPFIFEAGEFVSISKEARINAKTIEEETPVLASALIIKNLAHKILAEYYYKFNRPKRPLKLFKSIETAEKWLLENFPPEV